MGEAVRTIYVNLEHTLVRASLLRERLLLTALHRPFLFFQICFWLSKGGRSQLKTEIARRVALDLPNLPYRLEVVDYLKMENESGTTLILTTAAPQAWAQSIADHLRVFDRVLTVDEAAGNLEDARKLELIQLDAAGKPFGYVGDTLVDRPIFEASQLPVIVGSDASLAGTQAAKAIFLKAKPDAASSLWRSLRPLQWSKNLLVFLPALAVHQTDKWWPNAFLAFAAFSLVSSAFYLLNDFCDIDQDRQHPVKKLRAQACGTLSHSHAALLALILLLAAGLPSLCLPWKFSLVLVGYGFVNVFYSILLKRVVLVDLLTLAFLYTLRIFAGSAACGLGASTWLCAFIFFLALSVVHLKLYSELAQRIKWNLKSVTRATYATKDILVIAKFGLTSGLVAVLVLALYVTTQQTVSSFKSPMLLFLLGVVLFCWIERIWACANRGKITGDPIVFILTDVVSYLAVLTALLIFWAASVYAIF